MADDLLSTVQPLVRTVVGAGTGGDKHEAPSTYRRSAGAPFRGSRDNSTHHLHGPRKCGHARGHGPLDVSEMSWQAGNWLFNVVQIEGASSSIPPTMGGSHPRSDLGSPRRNSSALARTLGPAAVHGFTNWVQVVSKLQLDRKYPRVPGQPTEGVSLGQGSQLHRSGWGVLARWRGMIVRSGRTRTFRLTQTPRGQKNAVHGRSTGR